MRTWNSFLTLLLLTLVNDLHGLPVQGLLDAGAASVNAAGARSGRGVLADGGVISLSGSLAFGNLLMGSTAKATFLISSVGPGPLTVTGITYPNGFSGNWPGGTIQSGGSQTVTVTFSPVSAGAYGGNVVVTSDAIGGSGTIAISGTGTKPVAPVIFLNGNLTFGSVTVGSSSKANFTIGNQGSGPLTVQGITYPAGFTGNWPGGTIQEGGSQIVSVTFAPASAGDFSGNLLVISDAVSGSGALPITGMGNVPVFRMIGLSGNLGFGGVTVGLTAKATFTISNSGTGPLTVGGITYPNGFTGNWAGGTIPPGGSQPVSVTFAPVNAGNHGGSVTVTSDAGNSPNALIAISGIGVPLPTRVISLAGNLEFGSVLAGTTAKSSFTVSNPGTGSLTVKAVGYPNGFSGDWAGGTIPAGGSQTVFVTFAPASAGSFGGTVTISSDADNSPIAGLAISGTGVTRIISLAGNLALGSVMAGTTAAGSFTIGNQGTGPLTVSAINYPIGFSGNWTGGTIPVGGSQTVNVTFAPVSAGSFGGNVTITSDAGNSPSATIAISGSATALITRVISLAGNLVFGTVPAGSNAKTTLTIRNEGNSPLTVTGISLPSGYSANWVSGTISAGGSQAVQITFSPVTAGSYSGNLIVTSDATGGAGSTAILGIATPTMPVIALSGALALGKVEFGSSTRTTLTISNTGTAPLVITAISFPDAFSGDWQGGTIPVGGAQNVKVSFSPARPGNYAGKVVVTSNTQGGEPSVDISATAEATGILFDPKSLVRTPAGTFKFSVFGKPGVLVIIEAGDQLGNWEELARMPNPTGIVDYTDNRIQTGPSQFYRLRSP